MYSRKSGSEKNCESSESFSSKGFVDRCKLKAETTLDGVQIAMFLA
jgi:hypothetical protein